MPLRRGVALLLTGLIVLLGCQVVVGWLDIETPAVADTSGRMPAATTPPEPPGGPIPTSTPVDSPPEPQASSPSPAEPTPPGPEPTTATPPTTSPTPTASATPTPLPTTPSPRSTPTATTAPPRVVTVPPTPPASATETVPITSAVVALVVLVLAGLLLRQLTTLHPDESATEMPTDASWLPATEDDVLELMASAGDALIGGGVSVGDVQSELRHIAVAHGLRDVEVVALPTMLVISAGSGAELRTSAVATGVKSFRLYQIEALDDVVTHTLQGGDPREAVRRIEEIHEEPPPYSPLVQLLGGVLAAMGIAVLLGSSWPGMLIAGALAIVTGAIGLVGQDVPQQYQALVTVTSAATVSLAVFLLARAGWDTDIVPSLIAPLITLLPGALLTTGVIELTSGQIMSGAGRLASGATQLLLLSLGIVGPALLVGIPALELTTTKPALGTIGPWLAVAAFGIGIVLSRSARPRSMGWILIVLYVAYGAQVLGGLLVGGVLSGFVGALAMTPVADLVARQRGGPPSLVSFTPAFWILVPGALGLMGVATVLSGDNAGSQTLLTTVVTMVSIALGVLLGRAISTLVGLRRHHPE